MSTVLISGPSGNDVSPYTLTFASEALGVPELGWPQLKFGARIGPASRYEIVRKLGWGLTSSTWLARDASTRDFVAVKVLTSEWTKKTRDGEVAEPTVFRTLSNPPSPHCSRLLDEFTEPGIGAPGEHLCLVMPLYGGTVKTLHDAPKEGRRFPLALSKRIVLHILRGLAHAHKKGVIHTDLKPDNIFFTSGITTEGIEEWLARDPSRYHEPEKSVDCEVQAAISQPLPVISREDAMCANFVVADWGSGVPRTEGVGLITADHFRPPEVILGDTWGPPADIWTFGAFTYQLITSCLLFSYKPNKKFGLTEEENMLYQMMCLTGEPFMAAQLQRSPRAPIFFKSDCSLKKEVATAWFPFIYNLRSANPNLNVDTEIPPIAAVLERCLKLDPKDRPTAEELLTDAWFQDADG
ncbi:kinase-like protein [Exidia glandulosa HHB12029]|uniref:Kinase-like protein n=1 Tax=Exidia glandulosa HHB12029 TaxID=1314781 RepID=A0A165ZZM5_EXIGL|nr:kinase-like protein [Exidia glandulosa HHB12029]